MAAKLPIPKQPNKGITDAQKKALRIYALGHTLNLLREHVLSGFVSIWGVISTMRPSRWVSMVVSRRSKDDQDKYIYFRSTTRFDGRKHRKLHDFSRPKTDYRLLY
jgi:hypothetical protein